MEDHWEYYLDQFRFACENGDITKVSGFINKIQKLIGEDNEFNNNFVNYFRYSSLFSASSYGQTNVCKLLISKGAIIDDKDDYGYTPLFYAAKGGYKKICELLINNGAKIEKKNDFGYSLLFCAILEKQKEICGLLINYGAEVSDEDLRFMVINGWKDLCLKVIRNRAYERRKKLLACFKHVRKI